MIFNIPQFIDVEDKIVGPLTAKQLGWLAVGGVVLLIFWSKLDMSAFILSAIIIGFVFGMLAFYRPNNQSLIMFIFSVFTFFFRPKMFVWKRLPEAQAAKKVIKKNSEETIVRKEISDQKIEDITNLLNIKKS